MKAVEVKIGPLTPVSAMMTIRRDRIAPAALWLVVTFGPNLDSAPAAAKVQVIAKD